MVLKEGMNSTSHELSDVTFKLTVLFPVNYVLPALALGLNIFSLKTRGNSHYKVKRKNTAMSSTQKLCGKPNHCLLVHQVSYNTETIACCEKGERKY